MTSHDTATNVKECVKETYAGTITEDVKLDITGNQQIPFIHKVLESSTVGQLSIDYSLTSEAYFYHIIILLLKI